MRAEGVLVVVSLLCSGEYRSSVILCTLYAADFQFCRCTFHVVSLCSLRLFLPCDTLLVSAEYVL